MRQSSCTAFESRMLTSEIKAQDIDAFIKEQKDNGVDALVKEIQKQLDKWKTENKQ